MSPTRAISVLMSRTYQESSGSIFRGSQPSPSSSASSAGSPSCCSSASPPHARAPRAQVRAQARAHVPAPAPHRLLGRLARLCSPQRARLRSPQRALAPAWRGRLRQGGPARRVRLKRREGVSASWCSSSQVPAASHSTATMMLSGRHTESLALVQGRDAAPIFLPTAIDQASQVWRQT